jgi:hypothetical protein
LNRYVKIKESTEKEKRKIDQKYDDDAQRKASNGEKKNLEKKNLRVLSHSGFFFLLCDVFEIFPNDIIIYHCMTASHIEALPCASSISSLINSQRASFNSNTGKI